MLETALDSSESLYSVCGGGSIWIEQSLLISVFVLVSSSDDYGLFVNLQGDYVYSLPQVLKDCG